MPINFAEQTSPAKTVFILVSKSLQFVKNGIYFLLTLVKSNFLD